MANDTIAALATAPGASGVAVVRVSGPDALAVAAKIAGAAEGRAPAGARASGPLACVRPLRDAAGDVIDATAVVLLFRAPRSYTGEDVVELQCHGGVVTPRRVLEACFAAGARLARRGEFTERAFLNGKLDYDQAESVLNLIEAKTDRAADAALDGLAGRRARAVRDLYEQALAVSSELEHALDVDEGELPSAFFARVRASLASLDAALAEALRRGREGRLLRDGATVVLAGPPNAGKSSLLNALVGESRAIVSDVPGTTRDAIEAWIDLEGWPVRLVDTAGLRETNDAIEAEGVARAERLIEQAEVVVELRGTGVVSDGGQSSPSPLTSLTSPRRPERSQTIAINAKCDLGRSATLLNVSTKTGEGIAELKRAIVAALEEQASGLDALCASVASGSGDLERCVATLLAARQSLSPLLAACQSLASLAKATDARSASEPEHGAAEPFDLVLAGNVVRGVAESLGALVGATYSSDLLDRLFSRFCVGK